MLNACTILPLQAIQKLRCYHSCVCTYRRGLWIIGGFTIVAAVFGFIGSARVRCCLGLHAVLSVIAGLGHLGLVIYLFVDPAGAVQKLQDYAIDKGHAPR